MTSRSEIERKFLVVEPPGDLGSHPSTSIEQGYLALDDAVEVRLRRAGSRTLLTVKSGAGRIRVEEEIEIDARRFESLWPLCAARRVAKTRFRLPAPGTLTIELDMFAGDLEGLVMAEVEFPSAEASHEYVPPPWFGAEVTDDRRYANRSLAVDGLPLERSV